MDFSVALKSLKRRHLAYRSCWGNDNRLKIVDNVILMQDAGPWVPLQEDLLADDWVVDDFYEEIDLMDYRNLQEVSGVYRITNTRSGRMYIGYSTNIRKRGYEHFHELEEGRHRNLKLQEDWWLDNKIFVIAVLEITNDRSREAFYLNLTKESYLVYNLIKVPK